MEDKIKVQLRPTFK